MILNTVPRTAGDVTAATAIMASVFNMLPTILGIVAGIMGIVWYCVLFYDRFIRKEPVKLPAADMQKGAGGSL